MNEVEYMRGEEAANPEWSVDDACYVGDGQDGAYFIALRDPATGKWFMDSMVDCDSTGFCDQLVMSGPFDDPETAWQAGIDAATAWCSENDVTFEPLAQSASELAQGRS